MYIGKIATKTPAGNYRIKGDRVGEFRFVTNKYFTDFYGDLVDRVGTYEDCSTLDEINRVRKSFGLPEIKK